MSYNNLQDFPGSPEVKTLPFNAEGKGSVPGLGARKHRKTTEWETLELTSWKLEIPREYFMQRWAQ